jgi:xanthine dehydrogenase accessory factor
MNDKSAHDPSTAVMRSIGELLEAGTTAVLVTLIDGSDLVGAKLLLDENGRSTGTLGSKELDAFVSASAATFLQSREEVRAFRGKELSPETDCAEYVFLFERLQPELRVVICGAGHVGGWLATFASQTGYRITLIDDREEFLKREKFPSEQIQLLLAQNWTDAVRDAVGNGKGVSIAVVTRGHNEDEQCMRAAIATNPDYVGLIGSKRRTSIVINRLREAGATEEQVKNIHAPIGLDIGAVTPEEVALAILAEIICKRRGGTGGFMSAARRSASRQR